MAPRKVSIPQPPSLTPERAVPILEELVRSAQRLESEPYDSPQRNEWAHTGEGALTAALGGEDHTISAFRQAQCGSYGPGDTDDFLLAQANRQLSGMIAVLRSAIEQLRWRLPDPKQVFVPSGSQHDAYIQIRTIIQQGTKEVFIIDPWVDETLWPLLTNVSAGCAVRILGEHLKGDFALEARKFAAQHGTAVEVRTTTNYHDRFIFLDGKRCFHLGASIKDAGNKAFALSEFERPQILAAAFTDAETAWTGATKVPI
ncbi:MAG TPA: hypothetical protein VKS44_08560 [Candidatus Acidoferrales bacterium]|nr:hypothetical protein [Candidatus Acidoferrales bacterium]